MAFLTTPALRLRPSRFALHTATHISPLLRLRCAPRRPPHACMSAAQSPTDRDPRTVSDAEWREKLSREEFHVLREKGTEYPGSGEYDKFLPSEGHFVCRACSNPLYSAAAKFKSGCGWPAFDKCYAGAVSVEKDDSFGMRRIEIMCAKCDGHLGHVFEGERMTSTNERHCVNSVSVKYVEGNVDLPETTVA